MPNFPGVTMLLAALLWAGAATAESRIALVIGNSTYSNPDLACPQGWCYLPNPANDARLISAALAARGFQVQTELNLDQNAMRGAVADHTARLTAAGPDTVGLFFFAGHGVQVAGENYLIPIAADITAESHAPLRGVGLGEILKAIEYARNSLNIVILDACRNNPLTKARGAGRGLAIVIPPSGLLIAYSTAPETVALDGDGANSPYAAALARGIERRGVSITDMLQGVVNEVEVAAVQLGRSQTPWYHSSLKGGIFYFSPPAEVPAPVAAASDRAMELAFWETIKDSPNAADFEAYLEQFPNGTFAALARNRLEALSETEFAVVTPPPEPVVPEPAIEVEPLDSLLVALRNANVRAGPSTDSAMAGRLSAGEEVTVTGKVRGRDWYRIALAAGGEGYVWMPLLGETQVAIVTPPPAPVPVTPRTGETFRDCPSCPEMVVVPAGSFLMGSPSGEEGRYSYEGPQHRVTIDQAFAVGRYEVTFAEWDACVSAGGCGHRPEDKGWGRGNRPVSNVSWNEVGEYVAWLSRETGQRYRLLTEAEWEYSARAGTRTRYWWGNDIGRGKANCWGCGGRWDGELTAPVGSFAANPFGLYDVHGNVYELVEDCWHRSYSGAPSHAVAWAGGSGCSRVLRGGSWGNSPRDLRSAYRNWGSTAFRSGSDGGFRVARTLD